MTRAIQIICALIFLFIGVAFHAKNAHLVALDLYLRQFELPLSWVVVASLCIGVVLGAVAMTGKLWRQQREISRLKRRHTAVSREAENLRALASRDSA